VYQRTPGPCHLSAIGRALSSPTIFAFYSLAVKRKLLQKQCMVFTPDFATLVDDSVRRIESGLFLRHSGIRFPQNPCTTCPFIGLCLDKPDLVAAALVRKPGVDLGLFDELAY
jgi:hypothetical protein